MVTEENPNAGRGSVVLDIGGDIGALVVEMPAEMDGLEVEIVPTGTDSRHPESITEDIAVAMAPTSAPDHTHAAGDHPHEQEAHQHSRDAHEHEDGRQHDHADHPHEHSPTAPPHVAVVGRPMPDGRIVHSLVYGSLQAGSYDLYVRPFGPVRLTATVVGGEVTQASWT